MAWEWTVRTRDANLSVSPYASPFTVDLLPNLPPPSPVPDPIPQDVVKWNWLLAVGPRTALLPSIEIAGFTSASFTLSMGGASGEVQLGASDAASATISELATDLWVYLQGQHVNRFRIAKVGQEWDEDGGDHLALSLIDYPRILWRRKLHTPLTFTGVGQGDMVWALIEHTQLQPGGDLGLSPGTLDNTIQRDRVYEAGANVGELIDQLVKVIGGPRVLVNADKTVDVLAGDSYPVRGQPVGLGVNCRRLQRESGADSWANSVLGTGDNQNTQLVIMDAADVATDPRGRWEISASWPTVIQQDTLAEHTEGALQQAITPISVWRAQLDPTRWLFESRIMPGDLVTVIQPASVIAPLLNADVLPGQVVEVRIDISPDQAVSVAAAIVVTG